ncbi:thiol-disulfide oxidoreductase DCC family protein [Sphingomonas rubra]|uniref:Predicted thiol-disulfide oxidoreductase YuxK, DCC family n=1 Tax=Sphingomonas rubra TaxID=634430 RepID=A0A1I5TFS2_9SPHN|nr:thiol-disulfide oxidoreductase DCC family protein [Sphingomonas rubra]SFP81922.1 Predicted thiol-disulfide oxidoreductase YuxK, DCC family [Sphingomonas rubra]
MNQRLEVRSARDSKKGKKWVIARAVARTLDISIVMSLLTRVDRQPTIILFDAMCVLCSANAQFVLRHDRRRRFKLASMQGRIGAELFARHGIDPSDPDTILVVDGDQVLQNSDAVLAIYSGLGWPWRAAGWLRAVPRALRDPLYRLVARNRYRLFGRRETCWLPSPADRDRVL